MLFKKQKPSLIADAKDKRLFSFGILIGIAIGLNLPRLIEAFVALIASI